MSRLIETKEVESLNNWDYPNTKQIPDGYDWKTIPEATSENMVVMMNKINELVECVNTLMMIQGVRP